MLSEYYKGSIGWYINIISVKLNPEYVATVFFYSKNLATTAAFFFLPYILRI